MTRQEHLTILRQGVPVWNAWRETQPEPVGDLWAVDLDEAALSESDLTQANLSKAYLGQADLSGANMQGANLTGAFLVRANLTGANLSHAVLCGADLGVAELVGANLAGANLAGANLARASLGRANLVRADLSRANLTKTDLVRTNLTGARLVGADLSRATLVKTILTDALMTEARVYGISAWDLNLDAVADQTNLVITPYNQPSITVDNLELAQFIYILLSNAKLRDVIDTITSKVVLILGRFTSDRRAVLQSLRDELRRRNLTPVLLDSAKPASKDLTGTIETLARLARFIIADISDPRSVPHELATIIPHLRTTPVLPVRATGSPGYSMFDDLSIYPWVLPVHEYQQCSTLLSSLESLMTQVDEVASRLARS